jgi:hypothetical protein
VCHGLTEVPVEGVDEVMRLLVDAEKRCRVSETRMNKQSKCVSLRAFWRWRGAPCMLSLSLFRFLSRTLALSHSRTLALSHSRTLALPHSRTLALSHSRTLALSHSRTCPFLRPLYALAPTVSACPCPCSQPRPSNLHAAVNVHPSHRIRGASVFASFDRAAHRSTYRSHPVVD